MGTNIDIFQNNAKNSNVILTSGSNEMDFSIKLAKIFSYGGNDISFIKTPYGVLLNATQMAKIFNKKPASYLRLPSVNQTIKSMVQLLHISDNQIVTTLPGSLENGGGTWMYEDLAIDFAKWLNPEFRIWCNIKIKEVLTNEKNKLPDFTNPAEAAEAWAKEYRRAEQAEKLALAEHARAEQEKAEKETAVKTLVEKQEDLEFSESFIEPGENDMLVRQVAAKLEQNDIIIAEKNLRKFLQEIQFFTKRVEDGQYELRADMIKKGYAFYRSYYIDKYSGEKVHKQTVYITGLGYKAIAKAMKTNCKKIFLKYGRFRESYL